MLPWPKQSKVNEAIALFKSSLVRESVRQKTRQLHGKFSSDKEFEMQLRSVYCSINTLLNSFWPPRSLISKYISTSVQMSLLLLGLFRLYKPKRDLNNTVTCGPIGVCDQRWRSDHEHSRRWNPVSQELHTPPIKRNNISILPCLDFKPRFLEFSQTFPCTS